MLRRDAGGGGALLRTPIEITVNDVPDAYGSYGRRRGRRSFRFLRVTPAGGLETLSLSQELAGLRTAALNLTGDCYLDTANMCDRS